MERRAGPRSLGTHTQTLPVGTPRKPYILLSTGRRLVPCPFEGLHATIADKRMPCACWYYWGRSAPARMERGSRRAARILVVDDEDVILGFLDEVLLGGRLPRSPACQTAAGR